MHGCCLQNLAPTSVSVNEKPCSVYLNITLSNILPELPRVKASSMDPKPGEPVPERPQGNSSTVSRETSIHESCITAFH